MATKKRQLRKELDDLLALIRDKLALVLMDWDDRDAVELETNAHKLEGISSDCQKAANLAGELAFVIDPKVDEKV